MRSRSLERKMDKLLEMELAGKLGHSRQSRSLRKFNANKLAFVGGLVFATILFLCVFAPLFTEYSSTAVDLKNRLSPPGAVHIFGTDQIGRDIWSRILYGGRLSILIGLGSALGATFIGVTLGTYAGYKGGLLDATVMKLSELLMSFPQIILVLILVSIAGQSLWNIILIFVLTGWPSMYRMTRSQMLSIREEDYVQALRAFGINDFLIPFKHMLPNAIGPIFVNVTLSTAMFILQESALSFLGLGVPSNVATWGNVLSPAQNITILRDNWWIWLPVGMVLTIFVLAINFIGDGLRDAADPSQMG
jgi:peptide/nickel transport system permease protein